MGQSTRTQDIAPLPSIRLRTIGERPNFTDAICCSTRIQQGATGSIADPLQGGVADEMTSPLGV
jgi:hypothetical protein